MARYNTDIAVTTNYIQLNFNDGEEIVEFNNYEIKGDVNYVPDSYPEMFVSETGLTYSVPKKQQEYFEFVVNFQNESTRQKFERVRHYMQQGYKLSATLNKLHTPFISFPPSYVGIDPEEKINAITASFSAAVIELPKDFSADRTARNIGAVIVEDLPIKIYRTATLPITVPPCEYLDGSIWKYQDWVLNENYEIIAVYQDKNLSGPIDTIDTRPLGLLEIYSGGSWLPYGDAFAWNATNQRYEPVGDLVRAFAGYNYRFTVFGQQVTLLNSEICAEQQFEQVMFFADRPGLGCADLSESDWMYQDWILNEFDELDAIVVDPSASGIIAAVDGPRPTGTLYDDLGNVVDQVSYDKDYFGAGSGGAYVPDMGPHAPVLGWRVEINGINVVTQGLSFCTTYFQQTHQPSGSSGLDYSLDTEVA